MKRLLLASVACLLLAACSGKNNETKPAEELQTPAVTASDSAKVHEKPEGYKSPHQEQSEEHQGEPSNIN